MLSPSAVGRAGPRGVFFRFIILVRPSFAGGLRSMNATHPRSLLGWPLALLLAGFLLGLASCNHSATAPPPEIGDAPVSAGPPFFKDLSASAGVNITYKNGEEAGHLAILE